MIIAKTTITIQLTGMPELIITSPQSLGECLNNALETGGRLTESSPAFKVETNNCVVTFEEIENA